MTRRFYLWGWPYIVLIVLSFFVKHSITLWNFLITHVAVLQRFNSTFVIIWTDVTHFFVLLILIITFMLFAWYIWDWIRGYALLDFLSYRLRIFLLRNTSDNTDQTFDLNVQKKANHFIRSIKIRRNWRSPHTISVFVRLPNNQNTAKVVRERIIGGLGDDEITAISWLNHSNYWPLKNRHWELEQSSPHYLKIIGQQG